MSGFRTVAVVLIAGVICFSSPQYASAEEESGDGETSGEVPLYYLQLLEFAAARIDAGDDIKPEIFEYRVQRGDTLSSIALSFGTDVETLLWLNGINNPHYIRAGAVLEVLTVAGSVHQVSDGDTVSGIAGLYGVEEDVILAANDLSDDKKLERGERLIVPGGFLSRGDSRENFGWPLQGRLTSGYGWRGGKFHYGIDIAAPLGTPFYASAGGRVTFAGYRSGYGLMVDMDHGGGYTTRYAHAGKLAVNKGQMVSRGEVLAYVGLTGNTTGPHLHFELHHNGEKLNPMQFLP